jgi:tRNA threonylcarbamoyladenosine biosynthesis protein TsaB
MSYVLGIDTSSTELGVGLAREGGAVAGVSRYLRNSHAEHISRCVEFLLSSSGIGPAQVDRAAIAAGPGSFTGLRIGISFLKGFCFGRHIKVLPVSSLESMAMAWNGSGHPVAAAFDARNGEVFWARFAPEGGTLRRLGDDALSTADEFTKAIGESDVVLVDTLGNAKSSVFDLLRARPDVYFVERHPVQRGLSCARLGAQAATTPDRWIACSELSPKYLSVTAMEKKLSCAQ